MKRVICSILFSVFALAGCTVYQIDSRDTTQDFYPPKQSIDDVIYMEKVEKEAVEIGIVTVRTERRQSLEEILPKLKQEAAILGGDIITDIQTDATGTWKSVTLQKFLGNAYIRANFSAKVLVSK